METSGKKMTISSFGMGGLKIQHPEETVEGQRLNLIQKYHRKLEQDNQTKFPQVIEELLCAFGRPSLQVHVSNMGLREWLKTSVKLMNIIQY
jgi:hypothetical protein